MAKKEKAKDPIQKWAEAKAHLEHMAADAHRWIEKEFGSGLDQMRAACIAEMQKRGIKVVEVPTDPVKKFIQDLTGKGEMLVVQLSEGKKPDNSKRGLTEVLGKVETESLWAKLPTKESTSISLKRVPSMADAQEVDYEG